MVASGHGLLIRDGRDPARNFKSAGLGVQASGSNRGPDPQPRSGGLVELMHIRLVFLGVPHLIIFIISIASSTAYDW